MAAVLSSLGITFNGCSNAEVVAVQTVISGQSTPQIAATVQPQAVNIADYPGPISIILQRGSATWTSAGTADLDSIFAILGFGE